MDRNEILVRSTRLVLDLYRLNITYITTPCVTKQFSVVGMNSPRYFDFSPCIASFIPYLHIFETWHSRTSSNIPFSTENTSKHTEISFRGFWSSDFDLNISTAFLTLRVLPHTWTHRNRPQTYQNIQASNLYGFSSLTSISKGAISSSARVELLRLTSL